MSQILIQRVNELKKVSALIEEIKTSLRFSCPRVDVMIENLAEKGSYSKLLFLISCRERLISGEEFPTAWRESLEDRKNILNLGKDDVSYLISFGETLGTTDIESQVSSCDMYKSLIDENLNSANEKCKKYAKMFTPIGALVGFSAAIIFI